jgi:RimJ/RimL family protein N-acetyltransferase
MADMSTHLKPLQGTEAEIAEMQRVLEGAPTYFELTTGHPPGAAEGQSLFTSLPPGFDYRDKFVWAIRHDDRSVGCIEVIKGWPEPGTVIIGLFLLQESSAGLGIGGEAYRLLEAELRGWSGITTIRAAVVATNRQVLGFWERMGFTQTGEIKPFRYEQFVSDAIILTKPMPDTDS